MMERSAVFVAVTCLLSAAFSAEATVFIVDHSGGGDFVTVQEAVDAACSGDTILIREGHYAENILCVCKNLAYIGDGIGATVLEAAHSGPTVRIEGMPSPTPSVFEDLTVVHHPVSTYAVSWDWGAVEFREVDIVGWLGGGGTEHWQDAWVGLWNSSVTGVSMRGGYCTSTIDGSSVEEVRLYGQVYYDPGGASWMEVHHLNSSSCEFGSVALCGGILRSQSDVIGQLTGDDSSGCEAVGSELPGITWQGGAFDIRDCHVAGDVELSVFLSTAILEANPRVAGCLIEGGLSIWVVGFSDTWCSARLCHNTILGSLTCNWELELYPLLSPYHVRSNIVLGDASLNDSGASSLVATHNDVLGILTVSSLSDSVYSNISEDPLFCGSIGEPYTLQECSPCVDAGHDGESIGAYGVGCECQVAVREASWGAIKAMFRQPPN